MIGHKEDGQVKSILARIQPEHIKQVTKQGIANASLMNDMPLLKRFVLYRFLLLFSPTMIKFRIYLFAWMEGRDVWNV